MDFELAQDLKAGSPEYVNNSVAQLYRDRDVPKNSATGQHLKNLDQHLMTESIRAVEDYIPKAPKVWGMADYLEGASISLGVFSFDVSRFIKLVQQTPRRTLSSS